MVVKADKKTPQKGRIVNTNGNGRYPTWKGLIIVALACMTLGGAMVSWGWSLHISRPHGGAATEAYVDGLKDDIASDINRLEVRQIRIEDMVIDIRNMVID